MTKPDARPLLLLDVDGVLNAFGAWELVAASAGLRPGDVTAPEGYRVAEADGYVLLVRDVHREWLAALDPEFEIVWTTMWQDRAPRSFARVLGIGEAWPWIDFTLHAQHRIEHRTGAGVGGYKFPGVVATVGQRAAVWVDDDLEPVHARWARERTESGIPTLLVRPDPATGWTEPEFERVRAFGRSLAGP